MVKKPRLVLHPVPHRINGPADYARALAGVVVCKRSHSTLDAMKLLTMKAIAEAKGISINAVRWLRDNGYLKASAKIGKRAKYTMEAFDKACEKSTQPQQQQAAVSKKGWARRMHDEHLRSHN